MEYVILVSFAFLAGLIDSMVGGGGLIQLPALLIFLPQIPHPLLFGTNKFASLVGTLVAARRYLIQVTIPWKIVLWATGAAFIGSFCGARFVSLLNPETFRPVVFFLVIVVATYTFIKKDLGVTHAPRLPAETRVFAGILFGGALGFYDGFFGPGTGSFLIFTFILIFGFDFLRASASAKVVNIGTNAAALLYFIPTGNVWYSLAIPMAVANAAGSYVGSRLAITKGVKFVRVIFLIVVSALILRLGWMIFVG